MVKNEITLLSKETIDQIAAGEVVERPVSVVKELVENAMDAGATAITVEIKNGGTSLIRVTDNGCGIEKEQLSMAFLRHSTSKLRDASELTCIHSLGFRGEALSSIGAVSRVETITKPAQQLMGCRYVIEGSQEISLDEVGAPDGTTIMVYQLFYNTPARKKFLKSDTTEGNYIAELLERMALSRPDISFCLISNHKEKLHTAGNGILSDAIYQVYGKQISANMRPISYADADYEISGFIGETAIARGNRSLEIFFINGRYIKSPLLSKAVEDGYAGYLMQHQYPFCVIAIKTKNAMVDVNVHPTKQEVRFDDETGIANIVTSFVKNTICQREDIVSVTVDMADCTDDITNQKMESSGEVIPRAEPFEKKKMLQIKERITSEIHKDTPYERKYQDFYVKLENASEDIQPDETEIPQVFEQTTFLSEEAKKSHRIIGQVFDTYWLVEFDNKLYIIDQHAAHEKVLYEKMMAQLREKKMTSQMLSPPTILSLSRTEQHTLSEFGNTFEELGFSVEPFGGNEYALNAVPGNLFSIDCKQLFLDLLEECRNSKKGQDSILILEKVASMSCKAAVKGNHRLSMPEIEQLISDLLSLENPYHCPHGRPTIISLTQYELEKKFKRSV